MTMPRDTSCEDAVVDANRLDGDDAVAGQIDGDIGEAKVVEQVASDRADRQLAVQILPGLADDGAPNPVAKPRCLRHDERERQQRDGERSDPGDDVDGAADERPSNQNAWPMLKCTRKGPLLFGSPFTMQARNRIELPADVEANRTDRRVVAETRPHVVAQVVQVEVPRVGPDVAAVEEQHARRSCRPSGNRTSVEKFTKVCPPMGSALAAQRRHLVAAPAAEVRRAAQEVALEERHELVFRSLTSRSSRHGRARRPPPALPSDW